MSVRFLRKGDIGTDLPAPNTNSLPTDFANSIKEHQIALRKILA